MHQRAVSEGAYMESHEMHLPTPVAWYRPGKWQLIDVCYDRHQVVDAIRTYF